MVRHCAGDGESVLDHIEPVHVVLRRFHPPPIGERARTGQIRFAAIEKVAVEREDDIRAVESRNQSDIFTERSARRVTLRFT